MGVPKAKKERPATASGNTLRDIKAAQESKTATTKARASKTNRGNVQTV